MFKSCILMRCCCATTAEQQACLRAGAPREENLQNRSFSVDGADPVQACSSSPRLSLRDGSCCSSEPSALFCLINLSWWAFHTFLIILPDICSQFVSNSSLCSPLSDSGRRAEINSLRRPQARAACWGKNFHSTSLAPSVGEGVSRGR